MSDERDSTLQALFAEAEKELAEGAFVARVTNEVTAQKSRKLAVQIGAGLGLLLIAFLFALPMQAAVNSIICAFTQPLVSLENQRVAQLVLPINNVAALVALCSLALWPVCRRLL